MPDYGRAIEFGYFMVPHSAGAERLLDTAELLDELGFDMVGIQDHPYQQSYLDTWTLLSAIAARTANLTVFPDVANLPLRPPAVLAKSAASLDILSGGRVELGLGAGAFWDAVAAFGGPRRTPGESVRALREAIEVTRLVWSGDRGVRFTGEFYSLDCASTGPVPAHDVGVWVGGYKQRMLTLVGEVADGWLPGFDYAGPEEIHRANIAIDAAAVAAGRQPSDIRRILNTGGRVGVDDLVDTAIELALAEGIDTFVFSGPPTDAALKHFAAEVIPRIRDAVEAGRRQRGVRTRA